MSTLTLIPDSPVPGAGRGAETPQRVTRRPRSIFDGAGGGPTLDDVMSSAWEELTAHAVVACPLCGGELAPEYGAHARPIGGRCRGCGTTLS